MSDKRKRRKYNNSSGPRPKNNQVSDINRLIEEGLRQQREKAAREMDAAGPSKPPSHQEPSQNLQVDDIAKEKPVENIYKLGNIAHHLLKQQQRQHLSREWILLRNNLRLLTPHVNVKKVGSKLVDMISHKAHGVACIYQNHISFADRNTTVVVEDDCHPSKLFAWREDSAESKVAAVYQHHGSHFLRMMKVDMTAKSVASSSMSVRGLPWDSLKQLEWNPQNDHLIFLEDRAIYECPLRQNTSNASHDAWRVWSSKEKTIALTALLCTPSPHIYLLGNRNGSILHVDTRVPSSSGSSTYNMIGRMEFCVDHLLSCGDEYHFLARDLCGAITLFDLRKSSSSNQMKTSHQNQSQNQNNQKRVSGDGGWGGMRLVPPNPAKVSPSRFWLSSDHQLIVTHDSMHNGPMLRTVSTLDGQEIMAPVDLMEASGMGGGDGKLQYSNWLFARSATNSADGHGTRGAYSDCVYGAFMTRMVSASPFGPQENHYHHFAFGHPAAVHVM